jgi:hypothetical protein
MPTPRPSRPSARPRVTGSSFNPAPYPKSCRARSRRCGGSPARHAVRNTNFTSDRSWVHPPPRKRTIDIAFDIDLGKLVEGHHVIARGIELDLAGSSCLHYDFVPALANTMNTSREKKHGSWWYWKMYTSDDVGTVYLDGDTGTFDGTTVGEVSWGSRDLDGVIPESASVLTLRFEPPKGWIPPEPWRRIIRVDLQNRRVIGD